MAPETDPKSFGTIEKQAPGRSYHALSPERRVRDTSDLEHLATGCLAFRSTRKEPKPKPNTPKAESKFLIDVK